MILIVTGIDGMPNVAGSNLNLLRPSPSQPKSKNGTCKTGDVSQPILSLPEYPRSMKLMLFLEMRKLRQD